MHVHADRSSLRELPLDYENGWLISMVGRRHYRAATVIAAFPETYLAVQDAIDAALLADLPIIETADGEGG